MGDTVLSGGRVSIANSSGNESREREREIRPFCCSHRRGRAAFETWKGGEED